MPDKPCLLRVEIADLDFATKKNILRQATKLRTSATWKKVYVSPDLTLKEQEQNKKLRGELRRHKNAGEKDIFIKSGKIVLCNPHTPKVANKPSSETTTDTNSWLDTSLTVMYWNARSLVNQLSYFQSFILANHFDIVAITETWPHNNIFNNEILPSGYSIYRNDRCSKGGGILLAIKNDFTCKVLPTPALAVLWLKIFHTGCCLSST